MLYCWHLRWKLQYENFKVWVSIWGQIYIHIGENQTPSQHHGAKWSLVMKSYASIHLFPWPQTLNSQSTRRPTSSSWRSWCRSGLRWWLLEDPTATGLCTMTHNRKNPVLPVRKFLRQHQPNILPLNSHWLLRVGHSWAKDQQNSKLHEKMN